MSKDIETMKPVIAGAVGNPARTCAGSCEGNAYQIEIRRLTAERDVMTSELAALAKRKPAAVIATAGSTGGCVEWTGSIRLAVGSKLYIRPIPTEPVNARLMERIKEAIDAYERFGAICTFEGEPMIHASTLLEIAEIAAEAQHAEPVRMTDDEIASELKLFPRASGLVIKIARAIETAVLRANGLLSSGDQATEGRTKS